MVTERCPTCEGLLAKGEQRDVLTGEKTNFYSCRKCQWYGSADVLEALRIKAGFNSAKAEAAASEHIRAAEEAASDDWKDIAIKAVRAVAKRKAEFTTDDVWAHIGTKATTHENRAMGAIMRRLSGVVCEPTDRTIKTARVSNHGRPIRVWRSLS